jgi:hypothetical protein
VPITASPLFNFAFSGFFNAFTSYLICLSSQNLPHCNRPLQACQNMIKTWFSNAGAVSALTNFSAVK